LGKPPEWLNEEVSLSAIRDLIKQLKGDNGNNPSKTSFLARRAVDEFSQALKLFWFPMNKNLLVKNCY